MTEEEDAGATPGPLPLGQLIRSLKRQASRVRDLLEEDPAGTSLRFDLSFHQGEGVSTSFEAGREVDRLAVLMRPFMRQGSPLELGSVRDRLLATGLVNDDDRTAMEHALAAADRIPIAISVDGQDVTARDVYFAYGEGHYFGRVPEAVEALERLTSPPFGAMLPMLFHSACEDGAIALRSVLETALKVERALGVDGQVEHGACIYCLTTEGDLSADEHVMPESLAGDELVLVGAVCKACNNGLSDLDQALVDFEPIAMLRVLYLDLTKKGRFPKASFRDFDMEKVRPGGIRFVQKGSRVSVTPTELEDGTVRIAMTATGRKPFDPGPLARAVFKVGLGLVAEQAGPEVALETRYDAARQFVRGLGTMPNHLLVPASVVPDPGVRTAWQRTEDMTVVVLWIFGVVLMVNLDATPFDVPSAVQKGSFKAFWLGDKSGPECPPPDD